MDLLQRQLATLLLAVGFLAGSLAIGAWWLDRTVFDVERTGRVAEAVLDSRAVREELGSRIVDSALADPRVAGAAQLAGLDRAALETRTADALDDGGLADAFAGTLVGAHRRLLGQADGPVEVPAAAVTQLLATAVPGVDPAVLAAVPPVQIDVPRLTPARAADRVLGDVAGTASLVALLLIVAGVALHPNRPKALTRVGIWLIGATAAQLVVFWLLPVVLLPELTDDPWTELVAGVLASAGAGLVGMLLALAAAGLCCLFAAAAWRAAASTGHGRGRRTPVGAPPPGGRFPPPGRPVARAEPGRPGQWRL